MITNFLGRRMIGGLIAGVSRYQRIIGCEFIAHVNQSIYINSHKDVILLQKKIKLMHKNLFVT